MSDPTETAAQFLGMTREEYRGSVDLVILSLLDDWLITTPQVEKQATYWAVRAVGTGPSAEVATTARRDERLARVHDWVVRVFATTWLRAAGLTDEAEALRDLPCEVWREEGFEALRRARDHAAAMATFWHNKALRVSTVNVVHTARDAWWVSGGSMIDVVFSVRFGRWQRPLWLIVSDLAESSALAVARKALVRGRDEAVALDMVTRRLAPKLVDLVRSLIEPLSGGRGS